MDGAEDTVTLNTHLFINFQIQMLLAVAGQASPVPPKPLIFMTTRGFRAIAALAEDSGLISRTYMIMYSHT